MIFRRAAVLCVGMLAWAASGSMVGRAGGPGEVQQATGRSADNIWEFSSQRPQGLMARDNIRGTHAIVRFSKAPFDARLAIAGRDTNPATAGVLMTLPMPDGTFQRFLVKDSPILVPELAAAFPTFRTYSGQGIDDPTATIRFGWTDAGFHSILLSSETGTIFIDPYQPGDTDTYVVYRKSDYQGTGESWVCEVHGRHDEALHRLERPENQFPMTHGGEGLRTYRMALAATGEYTVAAGGSKAQALARMTTTMNRVNGIYERELSVRMTVATGTVGDPTALIFTDGATDPYTNNDGEAMLSQNQTTLDNPAFMGAANYDIGHVFSTGGGRCRVLGYAV